VLGLGVVSLLDVPSLVANTSMGGTIAVLGPREVTSHGLPFMVCVVIQGDVWVFYLGEIGWIALTPHLRKWRGTGLIRFVLTSVLSLFLTLALIFNFAGGTRGGLLVDRLRLLSTHDQRSKVVSYGPPWAHYLSGYQDRLLGGPLGLLGLCHTAPDGVGRKDYSGGVLG
jgi:hypothetical protein